MEFGELLQQLLDAAAARRGLPRRNMASALAAEIGMDRSLVYRWLRGDDVPSLRSGHVANMIRCLEVDRASAARLEQAQISSLRGEALRPVRTTRTDPWVNAAVRGLVEPRPVSPPVRLAPLSRTRKPAHRAEIEHVQGRDEVLRAAMAALEEAPRAELSGSLPIVISTQGAELWRANPHELALRQQWRQGIRGVLERGWRVRQIWRLQHVAQTIRLVEVMLDLVGFEGYQPGYFTQYGSLHPPCDFLAIPGNVAIQLFGAGDSEHIDAAFIFRDPTHVEMIHQHLQLQIASAKEFYQRFHGPDQELTFTRAMVGSEIKPGGRLLVKDGLSALTFPPAWLVDDSFHAHRVTEIGAVSRTDVPEYMGLLRQRWGAFLQHIRSPGNAHMNVCPRRAVEQLIAGRCCPADTWLFGPVVPRPLILAQLRHVVAMLRDFDHYHLALVDEETARAFSVGTTWGVTGEAVHFSIPTPASNESGELSPIGLMISEPHVTRAFRDYFDMLWQERIAEHEKDKTEIIAWLEAQVRMVEARAADD